MLRGGFILRWVRFESTAPHNMTHKWVILENIHAITLAASWNSETKRGVSWTGILEAWGGGNAVWNSKHMGGFSSAFPEGEDGESFT